MGGFHCFLGKASSVEDGSISLKKEPQKGFSWAVSQPSYAKSDRTLLELGDVQDRIAADKGSAFPKLGRHRRHVSPAK